MQPFEGFLRLTLNIYELIMNDMKKKILFSVVASMLLLVSCDKLGLVKKDFRNDLEGYYTVNHKCDRTSALPDPPSGVVLEETIEMKVVKGDSDSTVLVDGVEYKLDKNYGYYKQDDFGGAQSYNYTLLKFFSKNKNDSMYIETAVGSVSLYETCKWNAGYNRKL